MTALVLANAAAAGGLVLNPERREAFGDLIENHWGEGAFLSFFAPSRAADPAFQVDVSGSHASMGNSSTQ